jgi:transcriptional regulator with XRE-family HTH domain
MRFMPNIALVLKSEIARIARKEVRGEIDALKKAARAYRTEIAALKRRALSLEQQVGRLAKTKTRAEPAGESGGESRSLRFSAKGLASQRRRLGLSAEDCGLLIGTSSQSVYNWEQGKARPRAVFMPAIAALRSLGKREALAQLATLRAANTR